MFYIRILAILLTVFINKLASAQTAIICLTYDDGLPSHLSTVIPQLDSAGLQATFFLNAITGASTRIGEASSSVAGWKAAAKHRHELGNHTLFHPCSTALGWSPDLAIDGYTLPRLIAEIKTQGALLNALDGNSGPRPYAYPCNNTIIQGKDYSAVLRQQKLFRIARTGGDSTSVITNRKTLNFMKVPSWLVEENTTLEALIRFAEKARAAGGMAVYQFHGIGAEFFRIDAATHLSFIQYLAANPDKYRVLKFSDGVKAYMGTD